MIKLKIKLLQFLMENFIVFEMSILMMWLEQKHETSTRK